MVNHPFNQIKDLCELIFGVLMIISALFAINKVSEGSKNMFAYDLLRFTVILGIAYVGEALNEAFSEVDLPDWPHYFINWYANQTFFYLRYISALQGWIFGICYFKSAVASSIKDSCLTES